jgi:transposase
MTRSLSADLRGRVIAAIEDGVSTREAARRFRIGISTAGTWYRRYRETGEMQARKQGQPSRSKLDAHEPFILGLIEDVPDITLAEIGERLAVDRGVRAALLRKAAARTIDELWSVLADCLFAFTAEECRHYFEAAGYDPE